MTELSPEQQQALEVAHRLVDLGAPVFTAFPNHGGQGGEFLLPTGWPEFKPHHRQVELWKPGAALAMVTGVVFDVIDIDPRNGGLEGYRGLSDALGWDVNGGPEDYAVAFTPSAGEHHLIGRTGLRKGKPAIGVDLQAGDDHGEGRGFVYIAPTVRVSKFGPNEGQPVAYQWDVEPTQRPNRLAADAGLERFTRYVIDLKPATRALARPAAAVTPEDDAFDYPADWTESEANRQIRQQLERVEAAKEGEINSTLGGAARVLGRFMAGGHLTEDDAVEMLLAAVEAGGVHSDSWNAANGKDWTARTVIAAGLARGAEEPWSVELDTQTSSEQSHSAPDGQEGDPTAEVGVTEGTGHPAPQERQGGPERAGGVLPAPSDPMAVARELHGRMTKARVWWRGDFYQHTGTHYAVMDEAAMQRWLYRMTETATYVTQDAKGEDKPAKWAPTKKKITDLMHALGVGVLQRLADEDHVTAVGNGVLTVPGRQLLPHSPDRFNLTCLPFDYEPEATAPAWQEFLDQVLPGDQEAQDFLAEWFGYVLSGRTDQQKMAALIGKRRSGKGTVARVLGAMLGQEATAGLDLNLAAGTFGLEHLIGKRLAISGDVRWQSKNIGDAVPILLGVIGEDVLPIHRKNKSTWTGKLGVRFMLMSNETPTFSDRSGALGGRMIYVKFDQSFYGREDTALSDKLITELPGILNWALDGLDRLISRGRFTNPQSGAVEAEAVRRLSDPIGAFIEDWCTLGPDETVTLDHLYLKYRNWCESEGRNRDSTTKEIFSRDLRGKVEGLTVKRRREAGKQIRDLYGISCEAM